MRKVIVPKRKTVLTRAGQKRLQEKVSSLEQRLREVCLAKGEAVWTGGSGWHDNFAFEELSREEEMLEHEVARLRAVLQGAELIELAPKDGSVEIGSTVSFQYQDGSTNTFTITDPIIADPASGFISYQSPLARALLGAHQGGKRTLAMREREVTVTITKII